MTIDEFFIRSGLTSQDKIDCYAFLRQLYPGRPIASASSQGYCSMTVFLGDDTVIQFRPANYGLELRITDDAQKVYESFAPETKYLGTVPTSGLLVYSMSRIAGIPFSDFCVKSKETAQFKSGRATLCRDFANFLSKSWYHGNNISPHLGVVGKSIVSRLKSLSTDLPVRFQESAKTVLKQFHCIEALPWVLTHGDIVASNIMVESSSGKMTGLVDWAEAEYLPFGVCFYGLEEILGELTPTGFQYYTDASDLRDIFWDELSMLIPDLRQITVLEAVKLARDLGVLLWHGIAFDDGAIDRVVQEGSDDEEIYRLDAFLDIEEHSCLVRGSKIRLTHTVEIGI